jgi:YidC/Oxa1 family membrane protein insertase
MANMRLFLVFALMTVTFLLFQQWQVDYGPRTPPQSDQGPAGQAPELPPADIPVAPKPQSGDVPSALPGSPQLRDDEPGTPDATITVRTDVLEVVISSRGGDMVSARLLEYPVDLADSNTVVQLFAQNRDEYYVAQSGLLSNTHQAADHRQQFSVQARDYALHEGSDELVVPLTWQGPDGVQVTKRFVFTRGSFAIAVQHQVRNGSGQPFVGNLYRQLQRSAPLEKNVDSSFTNPGRYSFQGAALFTAQEKYEKFDYEDIDDEPVSRQSTGGWAGMVQHYFLAAWVPPASENTSFSTAQLTPAGKARRYLVRAVSPALQIEPGESADIDSTLYVGPKLQETIDELAEGLALTVDYGIFTPFSKVLYWLLSHIYSLVGNWGWAIILLTVLVKGVFFKLTEAQYKSMAKMRKLQPRILALKERYGDDRQQFNVAMMEIYKKEKVNPLGGCLPLLIQIPVFIALYWVLLESVELRQASFMLWLNDLSSPDPYFILPIINGAAMFMTTKLSPNPAADPIQQKIMLAMPLVFSVMFAFFQSGLVLYWAVNSVLSLAQQWVITKRIDRE